MDISEKNGSAVEEGWVRGLGKRCDGDEAQNGEGRTGSRRRDRRGEIGMRRRAMEGDRRRVRRRGGERRRR